MKGDSTEAGSELPLVDLMTSRPEVFALTEGKAGLPGPLLTASMSRSCLGGGGGGVGVKGVGPRIPCQTPDPHNGTALQTGPGLWWVTEGKRGSRREAP